MDWVQSPARQEIAQRGLFPLAKKKSLYIKHEQIGFIVDNISMLALTLKIISKFPVKLSNLLSSSLSSVHADSVFCSGCSSPSLDIDTDGLRIKGSKVSKEGYPISLNPRD